MTNQNRDFFPHEILQDAINKSTVKSNASFKSLSILSFLGGAYVGFGYLAFLGSIFSNHASCILR